MNKGVFMKQRIFNFGIVFGMAVVLFLSSGCARVGTDFDSAKVYEITVGKTTKEDIKTVFGRPWRIGIEDGKTTWTYGRYEYRVFGKSDTKDLVVRFDSEGIVTSYTFNTTKHNE